MARQNADFFHGVGDYANFIRTHLMSPLSRAHAGGAARAAEADACEALPTVHIAGLPAILTAIQFWWPSGTAYQILIEPPDEGHGYV